MKSIGIISIAILLSWNVKAQDKKNEIYIGFNGAEHFDNSPYRLNRGGIGYNSVVPIFPTPVT